LDGSQNEMTLRVISRKTDWEKEFPTKKDRVGSTKRIYFQNGYAEYDRHGEQKKDRKEKAGNLDKFVQPIILQSYFSKRQWIYPI